MFDDIGFYCERMKADRARRASMRRISIAMALSLLPVLGCSSQEAVSVPTGSAKSKSILAKGGGADSSATGQVLNIDFSVPPASEQANLSALALVGVLSYVRPTTLSGASSMGGAIMEVTNGAVAAPQLVQPPVFAQGSEFIPLAAQGKDFWMVKKSGDSVDVFRPLSAIQGEIPAELPQHMKVNLKSASQVIGFSDDMVVIKGQGSVWYVKRESERLRAFEIPLPDGAEIPVAAGRVFSSTEQFWIAGGTSVWLYSNDGSGWTIRRHALNVKATKDKMTLLAGHFVSANSSLELKGSAIGKFGSQTMTFGLRFEANLPSTPTPVVPMTFAEANAFCNGCHASTSNNTAAKAKLSGTETLATWQSSKDSIVAAVQSDFMPISKLTAENKARFLLFAQDPK
jgi:hypothetical protein